MEFRIGVAGCGRMGMPMARALAKAGLDVRGFDVRPIAEFDSFAGNMDLNPGTFMDGRNVLMTVVRDIKQTNDVLFDDQAFLSKASDLTHLIVCSTLSPRYLQELKQRVPAHVQLVDAPMSGAAIAAEECRLSFMLGGETSSLDELAPMFEAMGTKFHRMGAFGSGMSTKVLNNVVAASSFATTRLVMDWAKAQGVDIDKLMAVMHDSSGQTWFGSQFDAIEFSRDGFDKDNTIAIIKKDVESALDAMPEGADDRVPRALIEAIAQMKAWE